MRKSVRHTLSLIREQHTIAQLQELARDSSQQKWSAADLSCGGGLLTQACIATGKIQMIFGTEINPYKAKMFEDLAAAPCLGDTFKQSPLKGNQDGPVTVDGMATRNGKK